METDDELPSVAVPTIDIDDEDIENLEIEYSDRAPDDWVSSGPLGDARGAGRRFDTIEQAERWARRFYGPRFKGRVQQPEEALRWAFVIRGRGLTNE